MSKVQDLATAIAALSAAEKQRLFQLLVERGELAAGALPQAPAHASTPDYILTFDGGSKGNPGWGYGSYAITRVQDGAQRLERIDLGDGYTSNEAEYDTLIAGLQDLIGRIEAAGRQPQQFSLEVRGDSALVLNQVQGKWQAKEPRMAERRNRCRVLVRRFGRVTFKAQPREESVRILGH